MRSIAADPALLTSALTLLALSALAGGLAVFAWTRRGRRNIAADLAAARAQIKSQQALAEERQATMAQAEQHLSSAFSELANRSLATNSDNFLKLARQNLGVHQERARADLEQKELAIAQLVKPIQQALDQTQKQIGDIEKQRHEAFGSITAQLQSMAAGQDALQTHTRNLVTALRRPEVRGQWGELTLRRVVELAGMVEHCDFVEQQHIETENGALRPDMVIKLPDRGTLVVDAKTPLDAYLTALEADTDEARKAALLRHARNVAGRVRELAAKSYWSQFDTSPELAILFIPGDQFLTAALSENPTLMEDALRDRIIIATPTSLVAVLKAIAYGWRQLALDENAEKIRQLAQDMHGRLSTFTGHLARLGRQLDGALKAYNQAVGSMERKVLPGARKFTELGVQAKQDIDAPTAIETGVREIEDRSGDNDTPLATTDADASKPTDSSSTH